MIADQMSKQPLFGGMAAMTIPTRMQDVSDFRPVPDHQEVYSDGAIDQSVIVEILDRASASDDQCVEFYWADCCTSNDAQDPVMSRSSPIGPPSGVQPHPATAFCIEGQMKASKGRQSELAANTIHVMLCVLRLPHVSSDVIITLSTAMTVSEHSAAAADTGAGDRSDHLRAPALFESMIQSFAINDWSLFGES
eukprot:jgi/Ulvmu1/3902/UM018_0124.1